MDMEHFQKNRHLPAAPSAITKHTHMCTHAMTTRKKQTLLSTTACHVDVHQGEGNTN